MPPYSPYFSSRLDLILLEFWDMSSSPKRSEVGTTGKEDPKAMSASVTSKTPLPPPVDCTQPADRFSTQFLMLSSSKSLRNIRNLCRVPSEIEVVLSENNEYLETLRPNYFCVYEIYFAGCGLFFPLLEVLLLYLDHLGLAVWQMTLNMLCTILYAPLLLQWRPYIH